MEDPILSPSDALIHGTNPVLLLEEIAALGPAEINVLADRLPNLATIDPEKCYLGWQVLLTHPDPRAALQDVFLFLMDTMELKCEPVVQDATAEAQDVEERAVDEPPRLLTDSPPVPAAPVADRSEPSSAERTLGTLRVPAERLDEADGPSWRISHRPGASHSVGAASSDGNLKSVAEELERLSSGCATPPWASAWYQSAPSCRASADLSMTCRTIFQRYRVRDQW